ncbi:MAG: hypothetical protein KBC57_03075 [Neisseriaceae bacterium]|nr:hypothetical protein [Neisseriaceae bacterium]MBP6861321.1 hypothetical protein [Neisseriaceae bacterium]
MAINVADVHPGNFFETSRGQLRKIKQVGKNVQGETVVHYWSKNANTPNQPFYLAHQADLPPKLDTFVKNSGRLLTAEEVSTLRLKNIILANE